MEVTKFTLGVLGVNTWLVHDPASNRADLIDCGGQPWELVKVLEGLRLSQKVSIYLTHAHADHIEGLDDFRQVHPDTRIYCPKIEAGWLDSPADNLSSLYGEPLRVAPATDLLDGGETVHLAGQPFLVMNTPGHSPGSVSYYSAALGLLFSGDVLFRGSVGRTDFPHSDEAAFAESLAKVMALPDAVQVFSGHGGQTTIGRERQANPYLADFGL